MINLDKQFPPDRYELIPKVAVFKTHQKHKGGRLVKVDKEALERIAKNHNGQFVRLLRAAPFAKGHTLDEGPDGSDVPEEDQPDVVGYGVKFFVDKIESEPDEDFLFCDLYLLKSERSVLEKYPAISPEYYPSLNQLYPISFLKSSAPELSLPPVLHRYEVEVLDEDEPYQLTMQNPLQYAKEKDQMDKKDTMKEAYEKEDKSKSDKPEKEKDVKEAQDKETKGAKQDGSDLSQLKEQMAEVMQILPALKELVEMLSQSEGDGEEGEGEPGEGDEDGGKGEDEHDLLAPAQGMKGEPEAPAKTEKVDEKPPVKFGSSATATNVSVPSYTKKEDYTVDNDELVRYKAEVQAEFAKLKAENEEVKAIAEDLNKKNRKAEAEKLVYKLENEFNIVFTTPKVRDEEVETLTELDPESAQIYFERAKVRYQKKLPNSEAVKKVVKYSADNPDDIKSLPPEEATKLADKIVKSGLKYDEYLAQLAAGKVK